jgi:integrase/recombinase XerD
MVTLRLVSRLNSITVQEALREFLSYQQELERSPETIKTYRKNLDKFFRYLGSYYNYQVYVDDIAADDVERYLDEVYDSERYSSAFRFNLITAIKCFFRYSFKKGFCKANIGKQIRQIKRRVKERVYLTEDEFIKLLEFITHPIIRLAVMVMFYAGLRINECINLLAGDMSLENNCIIVRKDKEKHTRIIPINHKLREEIIKYVDSRREVNETDRFFATRTGTLSANYTNVIIKQAVKAAGLNKTVTCHIFRHAFASNLVSKGADIAQVQKLLGHTDIKSTDIYLHSNMNELKQTVHLMS